MAQNNSDTNDKASLKPITIIGRPKHLDPKIPKVVSDDFVIHASGNDGSDHFTLAFMTANIQLSSTDSSGKVDGFSEDHSLIDGRGDGIFAVKFNDKTNKFELSNPEQPNPHEFGLNEIGSTSFANITFLREHRLQMLGEKTGEIDPRS